MLGKVTAAVVVIWIALLGMGNYEYLDGPRQMFAVLVGLLALIWLGKLLLHWKHGGKSAGLPALRFKNI